MKLADKNLSLVADTQKKILARHLALSQCGKNSQGDLHQVEKKYYIVKMLKQFNHCFFIKKYA